MSIKDKVDDKDNLKETRELKDTIKLTANRKSFNADAIKIEGLECNMKHCKEKDVKAKVEDKIECREERSVLTKEDYVQETKKRN